jgi:hypothetical protein
MWEKRHPKEVHLQKKLWNKKNPKKVSLSKKEWRERNPQNKRAQEKLQYAVRKGKIKRKPCEVCNSKIQIEAHHDDYSKPLKVRWLCQKHHNELHLNK